MRKGIIKLADMPAMPLKGATCVIMHPTSGQWITSIVKRFVNHDIFSNQAEMIIDDGAGGCFRSLEGLKRIVVDDGKRLYPVSIGQWGKLIENNLLGEEMVFEPDEQNISDEETYNVEKPTSNYGLAIVKQISVAYAKHCEGLYRAQGGRFEHIADLSFDEFIKTMPF
jgi:hypothetical protein